MSAFEKFTMVTMSRTEIKKFPRNPRKITSEAKKRLKLALEKYGLVAPLTLNTRTGNLVSGHQRMAILDALEGSKDYSLQIATIDVDESQEKELVVFLNNQSSMGHWQDDELLSILTDEGVDRNALGFSETELTYFNRLLTENNAQESAAMEYFREMGETHDKLQESIKDNVDDIAQDKKTRKEIWLATVDEMFEAPPPKPPEEDVANETYRTARESWKKQDTSQEVVLKIVFRNEDNKRKWLQRYGQPPDLGLIHEQEWQTN